MFTIVHTTAGLTTALLIKDPVMSVTISFLSHEVLDRILGEGNFYPNRLSMAIIELGAFVALALILCYTKNYLPLSCIVTANIHDIIDKSFGNNKVFEVHSTTPKLFLGKGATLLINFVCLIFILLIGAIYV